MGRDDEPVDSMEIDGPQQLKVEGPAAVPERFNADYLRVYYGKAIRSLLTRGTD
jgi:DNA primase small subunit